MFLVVFRPLHCIYILMNTGACLQFFLPSAVCHLAVCAFEPLAKWSFSIGEHDVERVCGR